MSDRVLTQFELRVFVKHVPGDERLVSAMLRAGAWGAVERLGTALVDSSDEGWTEVWAGRGPQRSEDRRAARPLRVGG